MQGFAFRMSMTEKLSAKLRAVPSNVYSGSFAAGVRPQTQCFSSRKHEIPATTTSVEKMKTSQRQRVIRSPRSGATRQRIKPPIVMRHRPKTVAKKEDSPI